MPIPGFPRPLPRNRNVTGPMDASMPSEQIREIRVIAFEIRVRSLLLLFRRLPDPSVRPRRGIFAWDDRSDRRDGLAPSAGPESPPSADSLAQCRAAAPSTREADSTPRECRDGRRLTVRCRSSTREASSCRSTSRPSTQTRTPSSLIVRSVYLPGASVTVPVASMANRSCGMPGIVGRYHM